MLYFATQRPLPYLNIQAVADNQGMIKFLTDRMSYNKVYPNLTLRSDWDLLEDIITQYKSIPLQKITFHWEKGHQDTLSHNRDLTPRRGLTFTPMLWLPPTPERTGCP